MTTLQARPAALDERPDERPNEFITTFMSHVASVAGYGENRIVTIARVKTLLLAALAQRDGASSDAWSGLYRSIAAIVAANDARHARKSYAYLQSFIEDNRDLAEDLAPRRDTRGRLCREKARANL